MKRLFTFLAVLALMAMPVGASAQSNAYGWSLSASAADPFQNQAPLVPGVATVTLWYVCADLPPDWEPDGMSAAEFDVVSTNPANVFLSASALAPFLNAGTGFNLLLAVGGCPQGPLPAVSVLTLMNADGGWNLAPSSVTGVKGTVDCTTSPILWDIDWIGCFFGTSGQPGGKGTPPFCEPVSVEESSWGTIKGLYR